MAVAAHLGGLPPGVRYGPLLPVRGGAGVGVGDPGVNVTGRPRATLDVDTRRALRAARREMPQRPAVSVDSANPAHLYGDLDFARCAVRDRDLRGTAYVVPVPAGDGAAAPLATPPRTQPAGHPRLGPPPGVRGEDVLVSSEELVATAAAFHPPAAGHRPQLPGRHRLAAFFSIYAPKYVPNVDACLEAARGDADGLIDEMMRLHHVTYEGVIAALETPLPQGWEARRTPKGDVYYHNVRSGRRQWGRPGML